MPPRYAYWTILIDGKATAFRARERDELLPTFNQLARKNDDIVMRYFARGRLWDTPEQAQWASRNMQGANAGVKRGREWRPGGEHKDPRLRFDKSKARSTRSEPRFSKPKENDAKPGTPSSKPKEYGSRSPNRYGRSERRGSARPRRKPH